MLSKDRHSALKNKTVFVSCIIPVYNEQAIIETFITSLQKTLSELTTHFEIIVVDDGSRDYTVEKVLPLVNNATIKLLGLSRNFGKEIALTAGLEHSSGEVVILMDADFQHPLEMLSTFLQHWAQGYDMVYGTRVDRELSLIHI